jgi:hypothetical protein
MAIACLLKILLTIVEQLVLLVAMVVTVATEAVECSNMEVAQLMHLMDQRGRLEQPVAPLVI